MDEQGTGEKEVKPGPYREEQHKGKDSNADIPALEPESQANK